MNDPQDVRPTEAAATDAIRELVAAADRYQSDVQRFIELHHPDVVIVNIAGRRVLGRADFHRAMTAALDSPLAKVLTRLEIQDIRFIRPDVALVSCVKHISDQRETTPGPADGTAPSTGSLTLVVAREHNGWRIASAQTTPVRSI